MSVLNVKDRVTEYRKRFKLKDTETGQEKTYDLEQVTGEVTENGTPINKALFDKVENVLSYQVPSVEKNIFGTTEIISQIQGQPNEATSQNVNTTYLGIATGNIDGNEIEVSYNLKGFYQQYESYFTSTNIKNFFEGKADNYNTSQYVTLGQNGNFIQFDFKEIRREVNIYIRYNNKPILEISTDGDSWESVTIGAVDTNNVITVNNARFVKVRFNDTAGGSSEQRINYFYMDITENISGYANNFVLENNSTEFVENQIILLQTPDIDIVNIENNFLNNIEIKDILQPNQKYELVYEDGVFIEKGTKIVEGVVTGKSGTVSLGFKPDLVVLNCTGGNNAYYYSHTFASTTTSYGSSGNQNYYTLGAITDDGFTFSNATSVSQFTYTAFKF